MAAQVLLAIFVILVLYILLTAVIIPILSWLWDFTIDLLNWLWEGVIVNLLTWATITAISMSISVFIGYSLFYLLKQLADSKEGYNYGTPQWVLFIIPILFVVGAPITAVGLFISIVLTANAIVLLIPFFDWGHQDAGSHMELVDQMSPFGPDPSSEIVASIYSYPEVLFFTLMFTIISITIIQQQAKKVDIGETSRYGAVGFGLASIVIIFPLLQMVFWDATSMTPESVEEAQSLHQLSCLFSLILVIIAVSKGVQLIEHEMNYAIMRSIPGAYAITEPPLTVFVKSIFFGLSISASCYCLMLYVLDDLDGTGISGISAIGTENGILGISIGLFILVITLIYSIRQQLLK